jgi:hypothetical protein
MLSTAALPPMLPLPVLPTLKSSDAGTCSDLDPSYIPSFRGSTLFVYNGHAVESYR